MDEESCRLFVMHSYFRASTIHSRVACVIRFRKFSSLVKSLSYDVLEC
jgi:hypothetical protein